MTRAHTKLLPVVALLSLACRVFAADAAEQFRDAQLLLRGGDFEAALIELTALREAYPHDVDYALARAQVFRRLQRDNEALLELELATTLAPDYEDVWRLRFAILEAGVAPANNDALRQEAALRFPNASWWRQPERSAFWSVLAGAGYNDLSNGLPSWNSEFVQLAREKPGDYRYSAELARDARYDAADYTLRLDAQRSTSAGWFAGAELAFASSPSFQSKQSYGLRFGAPFGDGWVGGINLKYREYATATVNSTIGSLEKYQGPFRFAYALTHSHLHGGTNSLGHTFTSNWYFSDVASVGITISNGEEAEAVGNGQVLETAVQGLTLSGRYRFDDRYALQWWLGTHEQGDFYRRQFLGLAISIRL